MKPLPILLPALLLLAGCASTPRLSPWQATPLLSGLPPSCEPGSTAPPAGAAPVIPGGLAVVRSEGRDVILVAVRGCVMAVDAGNGAAELLPTHGDSIAPTMVDGTSNGLAFGSSLSGTVRAIDATGAITFNASGLHHPQGVRLVPGGSLLVAEAAASRVLRLGPHEDSRPKLVADGLDWPCGLLLADATQAYITESQGGRVSRIRLDRYERKEIAGGLDRPQGIARMADGRLAVVEAGKRRLIAVEVVTGQVEVLATDLPLTLVGADGATDPHAMADVAAAPDGTLYVSGNATRTILKVTPRPRPAG